MEESAAAGASAGTGEAGGAGATGGAGAAGEAATAADVLRSVYPPLEPSELPARPYPETILSHTTTSRRLANNMMHNHNHRTFFQPALYPPLMKWDPHNAMAQRVRGEVAKWEADGDGGGGGSKVRPAAPLTQLFRWSTSVDRDEGELRRTAESRADSPRV